jgi:D-sedoheptulose 7-phosphate isomerase
MKSSASTPVPAQPIAAQPSARDRAQAHLLASIATKQRLLDHGLDPILAAADLLIASLQSGGKLMLCGNGGSAADAQHIAAEFVSTLTHSFPRPGIAAIALTTDTSFLTAHANDFDFHGIFERQVQALGRPGDLLIGISTSGNSENVLRAIRYAASHGIATLALTGASGGKMKDAAQLTICVPSSTTSHVQESHIAIGHILCDLAEQALFPNWTPDSNE